VKDLLADLCLLAGLALVGVGLWEWSPALSKTVMGGLLVAGGAFAYLCKPLRRR